MYVCMYIYIVYIAFDEFIIQVKKGSYYTNVNPLCTFSLQNTLWHFLEEEITKK